MRLVLAVPVGGLLAGAACGLRWPDVPLAWLVAVLAGWATLATHASRVGNTTLLAATACGAFAVGGAALSADAWHRAWRPTLRVVFESIARDTRAESLRAGRRPPLDDSAAVVLTGRLRTDASITSGGAVSLALDVDAIGRNGSFGTIEAAANPVRGGVLLTVLGSLGAYQSAEWRAGRRIRAPAELRRVARYLNPGVPDQERSLARRGVSLVGTVKSASLVSIEGPGSPLQELASSIRAYTRRALADAVGRWSPRAAAVVSAIVIGDRTGLDADVERSLQESGTYHVIAISGGNIALLAGLTLAVFRMAGMFGRAAMLSAAAGLVAYGFIVGGGASVNRAVLMAAVYFIGRAWDLRGPPFQGLVLVAGILVVVDPLSVADPASLLTFGATAGIMAIAQLVPLTALPRWLAPAAALFLASVAAELALLPVSTTLFSRVTFAGLLLNFGAIPLMGVAQLAGMAAVPLHAVWPSVAGMVGWVAAAGAEGLVHTADLVQLAPWLTWRVAAPGLMTIAFYYAAAIGACLTWQARRSPTRATLPWQARTRAICLAMTAMSAAWIVAGPLTGVAPHGDGRLHVTYIDVGQGDAALVRFPRGAAWLIDVGGLTGSSSFDFGDRVVGPVLRRFGIRRLATLVLTHGDADHVGGARSVLREFHPWEVWDGVPVPPHALLRQLRQDALERGIRWTSVQRADRADIDGVSVSVWNPPLPEWERQDVRNDDSVVIELRWGSVSFVFTGDIGREVEAEIAARFEPSPLRVLKVAHHGSSTSSSNAFVRVVAPTVAVVSVGRSNSFGHPAQEVLDRLTAIESTVFRTDRDGAVTIDTDGVSLVATTFSGEVVHIRRRHDG